MNKRKKKKKKISIALLLFLVFPSSPFFFKLSAARVDIFVKKKRERERESSNLACVDTNKCGTSSSFERSVSSRVAIAGRTRDVVLKKCGKPDATNGKHMEMRENQLIFF